MKELPVTFTSRGKQIVGMLHVPSRKNPPVIIMLHGWAMGKQGNPQFTFVRAARQFCRGGFAVLRFDFRGVGDSEGDFDDYNQRSMLEDFSSALKYVKSLKGLDSGRIGVLGWSMGGSTAIIGSVGRKDVRCVVSWASPADHADLWQPSMVDELRKRGRIVVGYFSGLTMTWKKTADDFRWKAYRKIAKLRAPILIINGTEDDVVHSTQAEKLYRHARRPKKMILIEGSHHGFYLESHKKQLIGESLKWFRKWLV